MGFRPQYLLGNDPLVVDDVHQRDEQIGQLIAFITGSQQQCRT